MTQKTSNLQFTIHRQILSEGFPLLGDFLWEYEQIGWSSRCDGDPKIAQGAHHATEHHPCVADVRFESYLGARTMHVVVRSGHRGFQALRCSVDNCSLGTS